MRFVISSSHLYRVVGGSDIAWFRVVLVYLRVSLVAVPQHGKGNMPSIKIGYEDLGNTLTKGVGCRTCCAGVVDERQARHRR